MWKLAQRIILSGVIVLLLTGNVAAQSVSITATVNDTSLSFSGYTSPNSLVIFTDNSTVIGTTVSDSNGLFSKHFSAQTPGVHQVSIWSTDADNVTTIPVAFNLLLLAHQELALNSIYLPPTVTVPSGNFSNNDILTVHGYAQPNAQVSIRVQGPISVTYIVATSLSGAYSRQLQMSLIPSGDYILTAQLLISGIIDNSTFSEQHLFSLNNTPAASPQATTRPASNTCPYPFPRLCYFDNRASGFIDLSQGFDKYLEGFITYIGQDFNNAFDINNDGQINSNDLSIVLFYSKGTFYQVLGIYQADAQNQLPQVKLSYLNLPSTAFITSFWKFLGEESLCMLLAVVIFLLFVFIRQKEKKHEHGHA